MRRIAWGLMAMLYVPVVAIATVGYGTSVESPYFIVSFQDFWHQEDDGSGHPTLQEEARDVTRFWQYAVRAQRAIHRRPQLRSALTAKPLGEFRGEFLPPPDDFKKALAAHGLTDRLLARESVQVYTIQLSAYRQQSSLRRFLRRLPPGDGDGWSGPGIYGSTTKRVEFAYGGDGDYKAEPLYVLKGKDFIRLRYGVYENVADAWRDADAWLKRFHVRPIVVPVPLDEPLVHAVLFGDLPGIYVNATPGFAR